MNRGPRKQRRSQSAPAIGISAALFFAATGTAIAADLLPIKQGNYVRAGIACGSASNADRLFYSGEDIGFPHAASVSAKVVARRGRTYVLQEELAEIPPSSDQPSTSKFTVVVTSRSSFSFVDSAAPEDFRWCPDN